MDVEKILADHVKAVAGGVSEEGNVYERKCTKPGRFQVCESKKENWESLGSPQCCGYCFHLKYDDGYYC